MLLLTSKRSATAGVLRCSAAAAAARALGHQRQAHALAHPRSRRPQHSACGSSLGCGRQQSLLLLSLQFPRRAPATCSRPSRFRSGLHRRIYPTSTNPPTCEPPDPSELAAVAVSASVPVSPLACCRPQQGRQPLLQSHHLTTHGLLLRHRHIQPQTLCRTHRISCSVCSL